MYVDRQIHVCSYTYIQSQGLFLCVVVVVVCLFVCLVQATLKTVVNKVGSIETEFRTFPMEVRLIDFNVKVS